MPPVLSRLPTGRLVAFSALAMPIYAVQLPMTVFLPAFYAQHYGLSISVLGIIFFVEKFWGALVDPIIGALSDRSRHRFGRRRSFISIGGSVFVLSGACLFFPPHTVTPLYLGSVLFLFYLGWSMIQIPFFAWSGELSHDYDERARVATYQTVAGSAALLLILILPTVIDQFRPGLDIFKLNAMGALVLSTLVIGLVSTLNSFPDLPLSEHPRICHPPACTLRLIVTNGLLMRVLACDFAVTLGQNIRAALFVFFVGTYMNLPQWTSGLFLLQFVFGIAAGPLWMKIGYRLGKHRAAIMGELIQVGINVALILVLPGRLPLLLALTMAQGLAQGSGNLMLRSMVADVADRHQWQSGEDRTGMFYSVFSVSMKAAMAAAVGIALPLVGWLGFTPQSAYHSSQGLQGLKLVFTLGPAIAHLISAALLSRFPLDGAAVIAIRRELDKRNPTSNLFEAH